MPLGEGGGRGVNSLDHSGHLSVHIRIQRHVAPPNVHPKISQNDELDFVICFKDVHFITAWMYHITGSGVCEA